MSFKVELLSFDKEDYGWWFSILHIDDYAGFDRSLFHIGRGDVWFIQLMFIQVTPRWKRTHE